MYITRVRKGKTQNYPSKRRLERRPHRLFSPRVGEEKNYASSRESRASASSAPGNDESDIRIERGRRGRRRRRRNRVSCENPRTRLATAAPSLGTRRKTQTPHPSSSIGGFRSRERHRAKTKSRLSPMRRSPVRRSRVSSRLVLVWEKQCPRWAPFGDGSTPTRTRPDARVAEADRRIHPSRGT